MHCGQDALPTRTYSKTPYSSGLGQIQCAFCRERPGLKTWARYNMKASSLLLYTIAWIHIIFAKTVKYTWINPNHIPGNPVLPINFELVYGQNIISIFIYDLEWRTQQVDWSDKACDLNSGGVRFESRPEYRLSWQVIVVFLIFRGKCQNRTLKLGYSRYDRHHFQFTICSYVTVVSVADSVVKYIIKYMNK
jgi:hypothetical protein